MELKNKVTNKELSKKIFDLGWKLETEFWWEHSFGYNKLHLIAKGKSYNRSRLSLDHPSGDYTFSYPAYLPCELMEILPPYIWSRDKRTVSSLEINKSDDNGRIICLNPRA